MTSRRNVVITGSATGIGEAAARRFGHFGDTLFLLDIDATTGAEVASSIPGSHFSSCDVTSEDSVRSAVDAIAMRTDRIDVLVNNAGGFETTRGIADTDLDEWRRVVELNLTSVFLMTRATLHLLRKSDAGRVINLGSLAGQSVGPETSPPYVAAKGGVHALTRALAAELAVDGITVNSVAPSAVLTDRIRRIRDDRDLEAVAASVPLGRYQTPEEVAGWIFFLSTEEAGFMTGQTLSVNGGRFMS
jgi:NAD(P)-dependent dehydrogenase (short-subunit alcohol dehydrogenase family)